MGTGTAYLHGIYPRSEELVAATRDIERGRTTPERVDAAYRRDLDRLAAAQRGAGLDFFTDGLLRWQDLFRPFVDACDGLEPGPLVRWFDNNAFYRAPVVAGAPSIRENPRLLEDGVPSPVVATLPSPFLFSRAAHTSADRNTLLLELVRGVLRPAAQSLVAAGTRLLHLEEPWLAYAGIADEDWKFLEKALEDLREGIDATLVIHTSFADAAPFADRLHRLPVDAVGIDLAETDVDALGGGWEIGLVCGCLDGRSSLVEPLEPAVEAVLRAAERTGAPEILVSTGSDLELLPETIATRKVMRLGEVSSALKERLQ